MDWFKGKFYKKKVFNGPVKIFPTKPIDGLFHIFPTSKRHRNQSEFSLTPAEQRRGFGAMHLLHHSAGA
jgi:hypothetical protein